MITLFGATGYTGRFVSQQLAKLELPSDVIRLAGRSPDKLEQLADEVPYRAELIIADANEPSTLAALFKNTQVLINCAGPFTDLGNPVVAMAAMHGTHYLDITNELGFVHSMRSYHQLATKNRAVIIPACGFEVAVSDCVAALISQQIQSPMTSIDVIYALSGGKSSLASRRSAIRSLGTSWLAFRGGEWIRSVPCTRTRWVEFPNGKRAAISFPSSETTTFPDHIRTKEINTWLAINHTSRHWAPFVLPLFARMARSPVASWMAAVSSWVVKPPEVGQSTEDNWFVRVEARTKSDTKTLTITGKRVYEITAKIAVYAAMRLLHDNHTHFGVLPPSAILEPQIFLQHMIDNWDCQISPPLPD